MTRVSGFQKMKTAVFSILKTIGKKNITIYAAAADYFLFISLVPLLMLLVSLIRFLPFEQADIMQIFADTVPESMFRIINSLVSGIYRNGSTAFTISIFLTLFSASGAVRPLMKALDVVYGDERRDAFPLFFLKAILYMIVLVVIIVLSFGVLVLGGQIIALLHNKIPDSPVVRWLSSGARLFRYAVVLCILTFGFLLIYCHVPARRRKASEQWPGAVFCAAAWTVFAWGFSLYVSYSNQFGAYGYIGTIMVAMMWAYFCLTFLLVGGCLNAYIEQKKHTPD